METEDIFIPSTYCFILGHLSLTIESPRSPEDDPAEFTSSITLPIRYVVILYFSSLPPSGGVGRGEGGGGVSSVGTHYN